MNYLKNLLANLYNVTPPLHTTTDSNNGIEKIILFFIILFICAAIFAIIVMIILKKKQSNQEDRNVNYESINPEDEIRQIHLDREAAKNSVQQNSIQPQTPTPQQAPAPQAIQKNSGGFLKFLGIVFLIILIIGGIVFVTKCALDKTSDNGINTDGNPVLLNRAATLNDFTLTESVEATITNLKESYILIPNVDIKSLEITFKYYDSSNNLITTKTKNVGNVTKNSEYTVSIEHSLTEIFKISTVSYNVTGGTVSYFA